MSSSKKDVNWAKYWKGKSTVSSTVKKTSPYYDNQQTRGQGIGYLATGQEVTYIDSLSQNMSSNFYRVAIQLGQYDASKPVYYTHIDNLNKPIVKSAYEGFFKPQRFGITNQEYMLNDYIESLRQSIRTRADITGELEDYLLSLVEYAVNNASIGFFESSDLLKLPLNNIRNDFGECLGPIYSIKRGLTQYSSLGVNSSTAKIFIPSRSNEPLLDYYILTPNRSIKISAKSSGVSSNTLKVSSIIPLVEQNLSLSTQLSNSKEYNLMKIINNYTMLQGPIQCAAYLGFISDIAANSVSNLRGSNYIPNPSLFANLIQSDPRLLPILRAVKNNFSRVKITVSQISYACDRMVVAYSKQPIHSSKFSDIVKRALSDEMFFVHLSLSSGIPSFTVRRAQGVAGQANIANLYFRSKNGYDFQKDKLGFSV